jgi:hypothetical protein
MKDHPRRGRGRSTAVNIADFLAPKSETAAMATRWRRSSVSRSEMPPAGSMHRSLPPFERTATCYLS